MAENNRTKPQQPNTRDARLKAALKANMAKRKAQARARASTGQQTAQAKDKD